MPAEMLVVDDISAAAIVAAGPLVIILGALGFQSGDPNSELYDQEV